MLLHDDELLLDDEPIELLEEDLVEDLVIIEPIIKKKKVKKETDVYVDHIEMWNELKSFYEKCEKEKEPDISYRLSKMIDDISEKVGFRPNFINYCVDSQTESLTKRGWKKYNEITLNDEILSYDMNDKTLKWSNIKNIYINANYEGLMHEWTLRGFNALVTPGHKFITEKRGGIEAELITTKDHIVLMGYPEKSVQEKTYDDEFVRIVGWAVTEGHYKYQKRTGAVIIHQNQGIHSDEIHDCLDYLQAKYIKRSRERVLITKNILDEYYITKDIANKIIEVSPKRVLSKEFILALTQDQRMLLIETMMNGDGWIRNSKRSQHQKTPWGYCQKCKDHIDAFVMLCTLAGLTSTCRLVQNPLPNGSPYYIVNIFGSTKYTCRAECINFHGGRSGSGGNPNINLKASKPNKPTKEYKGVVWCPETEYGTWVCRRNGTIYTNHNSFKIDMCGDAKLKMFKALRDKSFKLFTCTKVINEQVEDDKVVISYYDKKGRLKKRVKDKEDFIEVKNGEKFITFKNNAFSYMTHITFNAYVNRIKKEKLIDVTKKAYQEQYWDTVLSTDAFQNVRRPRVMDYDENDSYFEE